MGIFKAIFGAIEMVDDINDLANVVDEYDKAKEVRKKEKLKQRERLLDEQEAWKMTKIKWTDGEDVRRRKETQRNAIINGDKDLRIFKKAERTKAKREFSKKQKEAAKNAHTLFDRKKREINKKLEEKIITKRTAVIQMNRAIADEKMRLIIENQRKEKKVKPTTKPKKTASASAKEFEYVEKIKEIKSLEEEGAITQAEFRKLKKKIIDSL